MPTYEDRPGRSRGLLSSFAIGLLGVIVGAAGIEGYRYLIAKEESPPEPAPAEAAPPADTEPVHHATSDPREELIETVAYQVAAERGERYPTDAIYGEVQSNLSALEAAFPQSAPAHFREAYRTLSSARFYYPELTLAQITDMLQQDTRTARGRVDVAAHQLYSQIQYEYFRPQIEALQAREEYDRQMNKTIVENLQALRERGEAANAARRAALANMGRRTPMEQRWFSDYLASLPPVTIADIGTARPIPPRPLQ